MSTGESDAARTDHTDSELDCGPGDSPESSLKPCLGYMDKQLEQLLGMGSGYVLDFSNRTIADFVLDVTGRDIYDPKYEYGSGSKANRIRAFWRRESPQLVGKLIHGLLDYYRYRHPTDGDARLVAECQLIADRLLAETGNAHKVGSDATQPIDTQLQPENVPASDKAQPAVNINNWDEGGKAIAEALKAANATPPNPDPDMATGTGGQDSKPSGAVPKPDGWPRTELIAQANHNDGDGNKTLSGTTFDRIRKAAGIASAEKGGAGAQRRFSAAQLRKLIDVAENGGTLAGRHWQPRNGSKIAAAWRGLFLP